MISLKAGRHALTGVLMGLVIGCSGEADDGGESDPDGTGGDASGGSTGGGDASGGTASGGATGGADPSGGATSGGNDTGGTATGGSDTGGAASGGSDTGGATHREVTLSIDATIGFDESPGADLAIAVDETAGLAMIVAIKYERPFSSGDFTITGDPVITAGDYTVTAPVERLTDFVATYPLVGTALTDVAGIRTMNVDVTAILLEGDLQSTAPSAVYVAHGGTVTLFRNDGPYDLEGNLDFTQVSGLDDGASAISSPMTVDLQNFYFEYDIGFF